MVKLSGAVTHSAGLQNRARDLSPRTASQQLGACHAHLNELGRGSADVITPDSPFYGFGDFHPHGGLGVDTENGKYSTLRN